MSPIRFSKIFAMLLCVPACTAAPSSLPARCEAIEVDPLRELVVTDANVVSGADFGFARVMGAVFAGTGDMGPRTWMDAWMSMPGEETLGTEVTAPWAASSTCRPRPDASALRAHCHHQPTRSGDSGSGSSG